MTARTKQTLYDYFCSGGSAANSISTMEQEIEDLIDSIGPVGLSVAASDASDASKGRADYQCDGTADEVQIQAALDALPSVGGKVFLSEGNFYFAAGVTVEDKLTAGYHVQGSGIGATIIIPADGVFAFTYNDCFWGSISDLSIEAASLQTSGGGVRWLQDCWTMDLRRIRTDNLYDAVTVNCYTPGPADPRADTGWIEDCFFFDTVNHVIELSRFAGLYISRVSAWNTSDSVRGIYWTNGYGLYLTDVALMKCGYGFVANAASGSVCSYLSAQNLEIDVCSGYGIWITGAGAMEHWMLTNLHVSTSGDYGIFISSATDTENIYIVNPRIISNGLNGIYVSSADNISIIGGLIGGNNTDDSGTTAYQQGVYLHTANNVRIIGTRIMNFTGGNQKYGVYHDTAGSDVLVQGCDLGDNDTGGFYSGDWTKVQVRDNAGFVTENSGTTKIDSGQTTEVVAHGLASTPTVINIAFREQGDNDYGRWWVSTIGATNFTLNVSSDPGSSHLDFAWEAKVR